jgi:SAM-dependent methyltransferase
MQFTFEGNVIDSCQLNFTINRAAIDDFEQAKCTKLIRINRIIRCPNCTSDLGAMVGGSIDCIPCNSSFRRGKYVFDFLDEGLRERGGVFEVENVSSNDYDPLTLAMIERYKDGLILDNGCGLRSVYYSNIVNFDIVPYHTTDVVGIGECLPFKDDSFDAIISVAVLEHVRDPFSAAREIERVLKPGGEAYIAVPFLQPFHGYPDHYYNMTSNGLRNLFKNLHEVSMDVPASGLPIWALSWILNAWASGLEKQDREAFLKLTVAQLAADPMSMLSQPFIKNLNASTNDRLACLNVLRAVKPPTDRAPR